MNIKNPLRIFAVLFVIVVLGGSFTANAQNNFSFSANRNVFSSSFFNDSEKELDIFDLVNAERRKKRLDQLVWDDDLAKLARNYSRKMARENFFDHYDSNGSNVIDRASSARIKGWRKIGENLFYCEGIENFSSFAVRGWLKSPSHRKNMLDRDWTDTGIGAARARDGRIYVTQVFIKR